MGKNFSSHEASKKSPDPLEVILKDWLVALMVFAIIAGLGCSTTRERRAGDTARAQPKEVESPEWVQVGEKPPRFVPADLPKDTPTDFSDGEFHGDWILTNEALYFAPEGTDPEVREQLFEMRSRKEKAALAKDVGIDVAVSTTQLVNPLAWFRACAESY